MASPRNRRALAAALCAVLAAVTVFATADVWGVIAEQLRDNGNGGAAWLAVLAGAWLLWRGRAVLRPGRCGPLQLPLVCLALCLLWSGRSAGWMVVEQAGALLLLPALTGLLLARQALPVLLAAWGALLFALPVPGVVVEHVAIPLQYAEARSVELIALLLGFDVARDGVVVVLQGTPVRIDEGCSGFSLLWPVLLACWVAVAAVPLPWRGAGLVRRALVLGVAAPVALVANLLRLLVSVCAYAFVSPELAAAVHDGLGWVLVVAVGTIPFAFLGVLEAPPPEVAGPRVPFRGRTLWPRAAAAFGVLLVVLVSGPAPTAARTAQADLEAQLNALPWRLGAWVGARRGLPPREQALLGADAVVHRAYVDLATGEEVLLVAAWHREIDAAAGHNARKCYRARGWALERSSALAVGAFGERTERFAFRRPGRRITVFESVLDAPVPVDVARGPDVEAGRLRLLIVMEGRREDPAARLLASRFVEALELRAANAAGGTS